MQKAVKGMKKVCFYTAVVLAGFLIGACLTIRVEDLSLNVLSTELTRVEQVTDPEWSTRNYAYIYGKVTVENKGDSRKMHMRAIFDDNDIRDVLYNDWDWCVSADGEYMTFYIEAGEVKTFDVVMRYLINDVEDFPQVDTMPRIVVAGL